MRVIAAVERTNEGKALRKAVGASTSDTRIFHSQSPEQILAYARENPCDVVFLETGLGEMDSLELARQLQKITPKLNIIFVSDSGEYAVEAMRLRASGYLVKPVTEEAVQEELQNLRYPIQQPVDRIYAQTFGNFELFVNGEAVIFHRKKSKELLAYLIDRHGAGVTRKEIAALLFEDRGYDRVTQDYVNHIITDMTAALKQAGAEKILAKKRNFLAVDVAQFSCDLYAYERGEAWAKNSFLGEYMLQYSWAENTEGRLDK